MTLYVHKQSIIYVHNYATNFATILHNIWKRFIITKENRGAEGALAPLKSALEGLSPQTPLEGTEHGTIAMHRCMYPNSRQPPILLSCLLPRIKT